MTDPTSEEDLLRRARDGDGDAFDVLIRRSEERIARLVRARMGAELRAIEESGDLVQTALVAAVRDLPRFEERGEGSFLRWLSAVVENNIRHHLRDVKRSRRDPARAVPLDTSLAEQQARVDVSPSAAAMGNELEEKYLGALDRLEPVDREVLLLHLELGWTHQEIATALQAASSEAVRKRVARALARLEAFMGSAGA
jgi:RNA polymerase sigma-70 factor (ECF subfamily)